jgi:hypothetical protein
MFLGPGQIFFPRMQRIQGAVSKLPLKDIKYGRQLASRPKHLRAIHKGEDCCFGNQIESASQHS